MNAQPRSRDTNVGHRQGLHLGRWPAAAALLVLVWTTFFTDFASLNSARLQGDYDFAVDLYVGCAAILIGVVGFAAWVLLRNRMGAGK